MDEGNDKMIDIKQAVQAVMAYTQDFGDLLPTTGMRLEETKFDQDDQTWIITMSVYDNQSIMTRIYRVFTVDQDGRVIDMRVRSLSSLAR